MISIETLDILSKLLQGRKGCRFEGGEFIVFPFNDAKKEIETYLLDNDIRHDVLGDSEISISLRQFPGIFYDCDHFLRESVDETIFTSDIGILFYNLSDYLFYEASTGKSYINSDISTGNNFVKNTYNYLKFFNYFEALGVSEYNSSTNHEFIIVDPEKGKFLLGYPVIPPHFPDNILIEGKFKKLENANDTQEFRLLLKRHIIDATSRIEHDQKFPKLVENIDSVLRDTENSYEMFLRKFDFEELKKNFRKERDEYFENVRGIVDRLLGKVVSIPISVSAAVITIYNLKDDPNLLIIAIVSIAYIVYSIFTSFLLRLLHIDSYEVKQDLNNDLLVISRSSNIPNDILKKESSKVYKKIDVLNNALVTLQLLLTSTTMAVLIVSFLFFALPMKISFLIISFVLVLQLLVSLWGVIDKAKVTKSEFDI